MVEPSMRLTEVIEVDSTGELIGIYLMYPDEVNQAIDEGRHIIMHGWSTRLFQPKWDFTSKEWAEGSSSEELIQKEMKIVEQLNRIPDEEMNAIAIMELTQIVLGGK